MNQRANFVTMGRKSILFVKIVFLVIILNQPCRSLAQNMPIDTSDYLPLIYKSALEYNLITASSKGNYTEVERMIHLGADVNAETSDGATPLIFAISNKMIETVNILLKYNADVNHVTLNGDTPLQIAVKINNLDIAESLIRYGADLNYQDKNGVTPLNFSAIYGYFYIVDLLIYYGAEPDLKANDGTTPLMAAIWAGYADIADILIQNGANMEARDNEGFTPLLIAAQNADTLLMDMLLKKGVNIYERNIYNWDALNLTIRSGQEEAASMLIGKVDKLIYSKGDGLNPYSVAAKYQRKGMIDLLKKDNFPSVNKPGIDQMTISVSSLLNLKDYYSGLSFSFKIPLLNAGLFTGFDTKLIYTKVLVKQDENNYFQYLDKSSIFYLGIFKEFLLTDDILKSNISVSTSFAGAYTFGNRYKGTLTRPESEFKFIPEVDLKWSKKNYAIFSGIEFMSTDFHKIGPIWLRAGGSFTLFFDKVRATGKIIKWY